MSGLSAEQHERITAANARKIEAVKLTMAEALPMKPKRPAVPADPNAPPRKRGRPKGSVNKPRPNGAQASVSLGGHYSRDSVVRKWHEKRMCKDPKSCNNGGLQSLSRPRLTNNITRDRVPLAQPFQSSRLNKDKQRDTTAPTAESSSDTNHAPKLCSILPSLSENSFSDGDMTPPLSIVDDYNTDQQRFLTGNPIRDDESQSPSTCATPLSQQTRQRNDEEPLTSTRRKSKERLRHQKFKSLSQELTSLLSSCEDQQKIKIACGLQRIISEQKDVQQVMQMVSRIETEVSGRSEHDKDKMASVLRDYAKKCDEKLNATNDTLLTVRAELSRIGDQCHSLRQTSLRHTNEIEAVRNSLKTSCDSVRQIAEELTAKLEMATSDAPGRMKA
ncbi:hypothetical protein COOONC_24267 [Cooperia oncophora]